MKHFPSILALPFLGACVVSGGDGKPPYYAESEPNDGACCADDFGTLYAGEFLAIHGSISDSGFDPYDGFAFTAYQPMSVEFRLYADSPWADLDVCLYDPQLGITVDCFESPYNPETGVAHILAGGVDFHLVVNSFHGATGYTLEVEAFPLMLASGPAPAGAGATFGAVQGAEHTADEKPDRSAEFAAYSGAPLAAANELRGREVSLIGLGELYLIDEAAGEMRTAFLTATSEGNLFWMGNPDEVIELEGR
jgi:hypothetical protein